MIEQFFSIHIQERGPGEIDFPDGTFCTEGEITYRRKIIKIDKSVAAFFDQYLASLQFIVLHLEFDLMNLKFMQQFHSRL